MRTHSEVNLALVERNQQLSTSLVYERLERRRWQWAACLFGTIAVVLGIIINRWVVLAWVAVLVFGYLLLIAACSVWAAKRGDREMGIGDTQGRGHGY